MDGKIVKKTNGRKHYEKVENLPKPCIFYTVFEIQQVFKSKKIDKEFIEKNRIPISERFFIDLGLIPGSFLEPERLENSGKID